MWERELVNLNPQVYVDAEERIQAYMKLSRHPGFDAPIGSQKKNFGPLFAAVLKGARAREEWALRKCRVLLTVTRTRRIPFPSPCDLKSRTDLPGKFTKVLAVRLFHYTNMSLIANGKPSQMVCTETMKTLKHSVLL